MTSREDVERLSEASRTLVEMALVDLRQFMASLDVRDPEAARAALIEIVPLLVREYGELSAVAAPSPVIHSSVAVLKRATSSVVAEALDRYRT